MSGGPVASLYIVARAPQACLEDCPLMSLPDPEDYFSPVRCMRWTDVDISNKLGWLTLAQSRNFATFTGLQAIMAELPNDADTQICFYAGKLREAAKTCSDYKGPLKLEPLHENLVDRVQQCAGTHGGENLPIRLDKALYILYGINCILAEAGKAPVGAGSIVISAFYLKGLSESRKGLLSLISSGSREASNEAREQLARLHEAISKGLGLSEKLCEEIVKGSATSIDLAIRLHDCLIASGVARKVPRHLDEALSSCMDTARPMARLERFESHVANDRIPAPYKRA